MTPLDTHSIDPLVDAVRTLQADDAFQPRFGPEQWRVLAPYLTRHEIRAGDLLIEQGAQERAMHLLEQGSLQVFVHRASPAHYRIAILRPGSVVGEPALFGSAVRMANVEALVPSVVWTLSGARLDELAGRQPGLACEVLRAAGAVMSARMRANMERAIPVS